MAWDIALSENVGEPDDIIDALMADPDLHSWSGEVRCEGCLPSRTGERVVTTDVEVEAREVVVPGGPTETWWRPTS